MRRSLILLGTLLLAGGCGSGDAVVVPPDVGEPIDGVTVTCRSIDSDRDKLPDCEETMLGTSPRTDDTDGDGLTDFEELVDRNFDPSSNNFRFNPRIADVPRLGFRITSLPDIRINYSTSESNSETIGVDRTQESARSVTASQTLEQSHSIEASVSSEASVSVLDLGVSVSTSLTESWSETMSWTNSQTRENRQAVSRSRETSRQSGTELTGGSLRVTLGIENRGYQSVRLESLVVAASRTNPNSPGRFVPVANLDFESAQGFPAIEIPPNGRSSDQLIFHTDLDLATALSLLEDSRNLVLAPAVWSAVDSDGRSFNAPLETIGTKCARIQIDYGPGAGGKGRPAETYFVSTVGDFTARTISASAALSDVLNVPFESSASEVTAVRDVIRDLALDGRWVVALTTDDGVQIERRVFDPKSEAADLDTLQLSPGSVLQLVYVEDGDRDGLLARDEFLAGADDELADTDGDGLDDYTEAKVGWEVPLILDLVERVYSSPAEADLDIDGLDDATEMAMRTNPNDEDSDRDGLRDDLDAAPNDIRAIVSLPLDGDTNDSSGNALDWQNAGATPTADRHGNPRGALAFDGTASIFTETLYPAERRDGASWSLWIKPEGLVPNETQGIMDHDTGNSWNALWVSPEGIGGSGSSFGRHFIGLVEETGNVTSGWHHVVGVLADETEEVADADTFLLYYDGQLRGKIFDPRGPELTVSPGRWTIGAGVGRTGDGSFVGSVDEVRFYERGLTPREVRALYEAGAE